MKMLSRSKPGDTFAAIDIGTNAIRFKLARLLSDGTLRVLHQERDPIRPGAGVFESGLMGRSNIKALIRALSHYRELCAGSQATYRAIATSAFREASNREAVLAEIFETTGVAVEIISGAEEARLIVRGALRHAPVRQKNCLVDIGGGSTEVALTVGAQPRSVVSVRLGAVRLTELFSGAGEFSSDQITMMRKYTRSGVESALPTPFPLVPKTILGTSGSIRALVAFASPKGDGRASFRQIQDAVRKLGKLSRAERVRRFEERRAEVIVSAAVILETLMKRLEADEIRALDTGLRDGILYDLVTQEAPSAGLDVVTRSALDMGRRLGFDEVHGAHVSRIATQLFEHTQPLHHLPPECLRLLTVAALLHDVGYAVSRQKHHRHSAYLIEHADIAGLTTRDQLLAARLARFHRRRPPKKGHPALEGLTLRETRILRQLAPLLRLADALDRGHHQSVQDVSLKITPKHLYVSLRAARGASLEAWDAEREAPLFQEVYQRQLHILVTDTKRQSSA